MDTPAFLTDAPRCVFFTGKGGVGKTSVACASAIALARGGARVLLVSTDPASNIGHVFDTTIGASVTAIPAVTGLSALEIDPHQVAAAYRERIIGPVRGLLPAAEIDTITEQLSGSCTTEIASFNEFTALLDPAATHLAEFDHIVFDTAPTGHTIRLLQLPGAWTEYLQGSGDASCLGPLSGLDAQRETYAAAVRTLTDPKLTRLVLVARAQDAALREVARTYDELADIGVTAGHLIINAVLSQSDTDALAVAITRRENAAIASMPRSLAELPCDRIPLKSVEMVGVTALSALFDSSTTLSEVSDAGDAHIEPAPLSALIDELALDGHGLIMCMGKGGVGKTTIAAAIATALATRGHEVHLSTTDPAAHLADTLGEGPATMRLSRIDPVEATEQYRQRILRSRGADLDAQGRAALAEDLRSPCTEEVAVFQAFSRLVHESRRRFVVVDTAPTGHTLLLLDATGAYHREISRNLGADGGFTTPLMRLQDPAHTKILIVTAPESTPIVESVELCADLERAAITPWAWVLNNSLAAAHPTNALLRARAATEVAHIEAVASRYSSRYAIVAMASTEPTGADRLALLSGEVAVSPAD
ncbi:arsenical pump-driving ATPase [Nocardia mangyaensis]|uniref:Arsenical pump-driving ATPase n=1 Tax=Nocardia mangyaensis TaxID=2213200 RepID=A0A1J0VVS5_9NOCA|nr:arsenical pump-driving ATPase [Nocardia mangyaensis]APE36047.1 arsenical pump-driving ATPase [Nocardia mangyaensis]